LNGGRLQPILNTFKTLHSQEIHFEMTHLVVPGYVDDPDLNRRMCDWIVDNLGPDHPLHYSRFFPKYKLDRLPPTSVSTLERFRGQAMEAGIRYVYIGNVPGHEGNNTYCHNCKNLIIERQGYFITTYHLEGDRCHFCGTGIPGRWPGGMPSGHSSRGEMPPTG
jgi:pyruvate formate lyase activating enzyme